MEWTSEYLWEQGDRKKNEDSFSLQQVKLGAKEVIFAVVSDGIGGLKEGETASGWIAEGLTEWFYEYGMRLAAGNAGRRKIEKSMKRALYEIYKELSVYGKRRGIRLGATVTACIAFGKKYLIVHVGDSRAYRIKKKCSVRLSFDNAQTDVRKAGWKQLTHDHRDDSGHLCRAVGTMAWTKPDKVYGHIRSGGKILLCTDGYDRKQKPGKCDNRTVVVLERKGGKDDW